MKKQNNIQKALETFAKVRIPTAKCKQVHKDSDEKKIKRSDRGLKYKKDYKDHE